MNVTDVLKEISERIKKTYYSSVNSFAKEHGLNAEQFCRWKRGKVNPTVAEVCKWRKAVKLEVSENVEMICKKYPDCKLDLFLALRGENGFEDNSATIAQA